MRGKTVLARALQLAFGAAALTAIVIQPASAQSNASGKLFGVVDAPQGATVHLAGVETGLKRSIAIDGAGRYQATALPAGHYRVELVRNGAVAQAVEVDVLAGQGAEASFGATQAVTVAGRRARIDVSSTDNGAVFTARDLDRLPLTPTLNAIVLLAPNTTKGDAAYGGTSSFGGSGVSENAFYLNGFPITNPLSQLGSMELPFGAIGQASVLTGGFGAEFGRSIGGVLNITSRSGTNHWEAGTLYAIEPDSLRAAQKNFHYAVTGDRENAATDGMLDRRRDNGAVSAHQYGAYLGGPLIKDRLFMFFSADQTKSHDDQVLATTQTNGATIAEQGWQSNRTLENRWLARLDWNITDHHRVEFTSAGDDYRTRYRKYGYVLNPDNPDAVAMLDGTPNNTLFTSAVGRNLGQADPAFPGTPGARLNMLRYTGNLGEDLVVTAMFGTLRSRHGVTYEALGANAGASGLVPTVTYSPTSRWSGVDPSLYRDHNVYATYLSAPGEDVVRSGRLDLEYRLGQHTLRAGIDATRIAASSAGFGYSGGSRWAYRSVGADNVDVPFNLSGGRPAVVGDFGGSGAAGYYVTQSIYNTVTAASSRQSAQYIEDRWQLRRDLLVVLGLRNDAYSNSTGDGRKFIDMRHQVAPRLAAAWDVHGDASLKVFGSAGRYYLQLPTQVAARVASRSTYTAQDFTYTGIDPATGLPTGTVAINTPISPDGEYGQAKDPRAVVTRDLRPNYQDELTLGLEKAYGPSLNVGAKVTYRRLGAGIDDSCDARPLLAHAAAHDIDIRFPAAVNCYIFNPGRDVTVWIDGNDADGNPVVTGNGRYAHFTAAQLGFPKARRSYAALDLFAEHPLRHGWYGRLHFTLSRSRGNMEGQTRSDTGQADVGTSAAWDFPEFASGADGLLPNDRKHQVKAFGFYQLSDEWTIGGNALLQSGRPRLCLGTNDAADAGEDPAYPLGQQYGGPGYGAEYYACGGSASPRGSRGREPWERRLDMNLVYAPALVKGLAFRLDVYNVFNARRALATNPLYDDGDSSVITPKYGQVTNYQAPRYARFQVEYRHRF